MTHDHDAGLGIRAIFTTLQEVNELAWRLFYAAFDGFAEKDGCSHIVKNMDPSQLRVKDQEMYRMLERYELTLRLAHRDYERRL